MNIYEIIHLISIYAYYILGLILDPGNITVKKKKIWTLLYHILIGEKKTIINE